MYSAEDSERLRAVLRCLPPKPRLIIDVGCGDCHDAPLYLEIGGEQAYLVGLDRDLGLIRIARRRLGIRQSLFLLADIAALPIRSAADWVVVRHPDVDRNRVRWERFAANAATLLRPRGALLLTTYLFFEAEMLREWLIADSRLLLLLEHPDNLPPTGFSGRDRYVLAFRLREVLPNT